MNSIPGMSSYEDEDRQLLERHGWNVRPALTFSKELEPYRAYITHSRGEFTVAKDQNVRLRSGWFSERSAQYLAAGQAIVSLQSLNPIYVNFGVPQQTTSQVGVKGRRIRVTTDNLPGVQFVGQVSAVDSVVNESTRNVQVQATLANPDGKLRPGMFVQVEAGLGANRQVIPLPASAVNYSPYGDSVYVVSDMKDPKTGAAYRGVRQQFIKLEGSRGDQVAVISGINPGDEIVSSGAFKLRNGVPVLVNNTIQPSNNPKPKPEDS